MAAGVRPSGKHSRIALIGLGAGSLTNPTVAQMLGREFPDCDIDWIDPNVELRKRMRSAMRILTSLHGLKEFYGTIGPRLWEVRWRRYWTTYLFKQRSRIARELIEERGPYRFTFQLQSYFDASVPGIPHYVYIGNTVLAQLQYPDVDERDILVAGRWIALEQQLYRNARVNFVKSRNVAKSMLEDYLCAPEDVVCALGGPNIPMTVEPRERYARKNILFVGLKWKNKGGPQLLEAFRKVRESVPDATLTIVGCSPKIDGPGVHVVGYVPPSQLGQYYADASVFCVPTRREAFGIAFIEAMMYKLPIVGPDIAAIPDFVINGENGFLVRPNDVAGYASALTRILSDETTCREMGACSFELSKRYTWENAGAIIRETIERTLEADAQPALEGVR